MGMPQHRFTCREDIFENLDINFDISNIDENQIPHYDGDPSSFSNLEEEKEEIKTQRL